MKKNITKFLALSDHRSRHEQRSLQVYIELHRDNLKKILNTTFNRETAIKGELYSRIQCTLRFQELAEQENWWIQISSKIQSAYAFIIRDSELQSYIDLIENKQQKQNHWARTLLEQLLHSKEFID